MFMFRRKRESLTNRLLKARLINETHSENEELLRSCIVSHLRDGQLESLVELIEKHGSDSKTCIPVSRYSSSSSGHHQSKRRASTRLLCRNNSKTEESAAPSSSCLENCSSKLCCYNSVASSPPGSPSPPPPSSNLGSTTEAGASRLSSPPISGPTLERSQQQRRQQTSANTNSTPPPPPLPHFLCCQIFRWTDLRNYNELKKLPQCTCDDYYSDNGDYVYCCNPYHWSKLCGPESPPPPYRRYPDEKLRPEDRAPSLEGKPKLASCGGISSATSSTSSLCSTQGRRGGPGGGGGLNNSFLGSLPTSGHGGAWGSSSEWCKLAYWELQRRVGALFPVTGSSVHVFTGPLQPGTGRGDSSSLCLTDLVEASQHRNQQSQPPPQSELAIRRTHSKIGLGVLLSQEADGVWAYNLSEGPLFVNSPTLDEPHSRALVVYKLPPGSCLRIFDWSRASQRRRKVDPSCGPIDPHSVRISFAKGWGPKYSRQEVTACPCWLEVLLAPPPPLPPPHCGSFDSDK